MATKYIVSCGCVVRNNDGRLLMVRQQNGYWRSLWIFPGGKLEVGETLEECARREVLEETGCTYMTVRQVGAYVSYDRDTEYEKQVVLVYYLGEYSGGELIAGDGVTDARWFDIGEIENMAAQGMVPRLIFQVALDALNSK